ncbi:MAG: hypothetical protein P0Y53_05245 [Candidatus Pseudobacter hemicellulosilyticus]|uniref:Uncharacterized protein n=1 Tax=Candidatus Pseudobacter hemicellulosilyticus TaxID=3121375 RepID=A0AAJ5WWJ6_9BACT|nr:MAG: hypothetical protein P0Y53_05245 [Pseudobacter sp.]
MRNEGRRKRQQKNAADLLRFVNKNPNQLLYVVYQLFKNTMPPGGEDGLKATSSGPPVEMAIQYSNEIRIKELGIYEPGHGCICYKIDLAKWRQ